MPWHGTPEFRGDHLEVKAAAQLSEYVGLSALRENDPKSDKSSSVIWIIKSMNDALVGRNCIKKEFLCLKGVLVLSPVGCNDLKGGDVQRGVGVLVLGFGQ